MPCDPQQDLSTLSLIYQSASQKVRLSNSSYRIWNSQKCLYPYTESIIWEKANIKSQVIWQIIRRKEWTSLRRIRLGHEHSWPCLWCLTIYSIKAIRYLWTGSFMNLSQARDKPTHPKQIIVVFQILKAYRSQSAQECVNRRTDTRQTDRYIGRNFSVWGMKKLFKKFRLHYSWLMKYVKWPKKNV